ncbi:MAG: hypothetical protein RQ866_06750, partial [Bacteroidales bacterium]|nr:hypothetical protein [Bacteroidales bacterium]
RSLLISAVFTCSPALIYSQSSMVKSSVNTFSVQIGDYIILTLDATTDKSTHIDWPEFTDTITKNIKILKRERIDTIKKEQNKTVYRQHNIISIYDSGSFIIPPISFSFHSGDDTTPAVLYTEAIPLEVLAPKVNLQKDILDINPNMLSFYTWKEILPWVLFIILISIIIWLWFRYKKYIHRKEKPYTKVVAKKPPHIKALERLESLSKAKLLQKGMIKEYHTELTDIIRTYFEERYAFNALEMTTDEIMYFLTDNPEWEASLTEELKEMLDLADLVKFAKAFPGEDQSNRSIKIAFRIVNETSLPEKTNETTVKEDIA